MMDTGLRGKNALITGAGTGIGRAIALALAAEGVNIAIGSNKPADETIREIKSFGVRAAFIPADVSKEADVKRMVEQALSELGAIDLYVNNAAITAHQAITRTDHGRLAVDDAHESVGLRLGLSRCMRAYDPTRRRQHPDHRLNRAVQSSLWRSQLSYVQDRAARLQEHACD